MRGTGASSSPASPTNGMPVSGGHSLRPNSKSTKSRVFASGRHESVGFTAPRRPSARSRYASLPCQVASSRAESRPSAVAAFASTAASNVP